MKKLKFTFLFFCGFTLLCIKGCTTEPKKKSTVHNTADSISFYTQQLLNNQLSDSLRIQFADRVLDNTSASPQKKINTYRHKIYFLARLKKYPEAIRSAKELLKQSVALEDSVNIGLAYYNIAYYNLQINKKDSAYHFYDLAKTIYIKLNDSTLAGQSLLSMAIIQKVYGDFNGSDDSALKALDYFNKKDSSNISSTYNSLAINSRKQFNFSEAIYYYDLALKNTSQKANIQSIQNNKALVYQDLKNFHKATALFKQLIKDTIKDPYTRARIWDNYAYTKWLWKDSDSVLPELLDALTLREALNDGNGLLASYTHLANFYKLKNPDRAIYYADQLYHTSKQQTSPKDALYALNLLIALKPEKDSKKLYTTYVRINDSIKIASQKEKNIFSKVKYNSKKIREENLQLKIRSSENALALEKIKIRTLFGALSGGIVLLGLIGYGYYRKQKNIQDRRTAVYKTETRIAKRIHDEVANDVVHIMNKLQFTKTEQRTLLDDLEKVYLRTRNISHENSTVVTGPQFEAQLKSLLDNFNTSATTVIIKGIHEVKLAQLNEAFQIELYRILQELMTNMRKHSGASLVAINFQLQKSQYTIRYSDNGSGVDLQSLLIKNGLKNVETRIKSIHGSITFDSALEKGFKAIIQFKQY